MVVQTLLKVTSALMDDHLTRPRKTQNMIQYFMDNLRRDMNTISKSSSTHKVYLESMLYRIIISISGYHEAWATYIREKDKVKT
jgi:hypothetical protein